jgi:transposase
MSSADEIAALRAALAQRDAALTEFTEQLAAIKVVVERLARENARLREEALGKKRERWQPDPDQLVLWGLLDEPEDKKPPRAARRARPHGRGKLSRDLPEERLYFSAEAGTCTECGGPMEVFGQDTAERLEWVPGHFKRLVIVREKCACPKHPMGGVMTAPGPAFAIGKGLCGNGLLSKVIVDKYADHIPLNRQIKRLRRQGVAVPPSTACDWVRQAAGPASVLVKAMLSALVAGDWLQSDATGFKVLEGSRNKPHRGHLYTWSDTDRVVYTYAREGTGAHPAQVLAGFAGTLVADGGSSFNKAAGASGVRRAGCWAHARRKFWDARDADPLRVHRALDTIREIFELERAFRDLGPAERARKRRSTTWPVLQLFKAWCEQLSLRTPPKSPLAKAANYVLNQWDTLVVFVDVGAIPAHNNVSELMLRQAVVGRKNYLFAGSEGGAESAATWYSLIGSCMLNAIDPWLYLNDVLPRLGDWPVNRVLELEPVAWRIRRLSEAR